MSIHDNTDDNKNHFFSLMPTYRAGPTHIGQDVREVYVYAGGGEDDNEEEENCNYHYDDGDNNGAAVGNNGENFLMKTTLSTPLCIFNGIPPTAMMIPPFVIVEPLFNTTPNMAF